MKFLLSIFNTISLLLLSSAVFSQPFITRWNLATAGSGSTQITFGVGTTSTVNYSWETIPAGTSGSGTFSGTTATITGLPVGSVIRLSIDTANFNRFVMNYGQDRSRLMDVEQWGAVHWVSMEKAFYGCGNLNISATDLPDLSATTSLASMFKACASLTGPPNIGNWNTANVTDLSVMFSKASAFNQPLENWDVSNVTIFDSMFHEASSFNLPIGNWDVSSATTFRAMFFKANAFNQPIGTWNMQNAVNLWAMFREASSFDQPLGMWDVQNVTNMASMFMAASSFNQNMDTWDTQSVQKMDSMFQSAISFNQPLLSWNTQNVSSMSSMFGNASMFNQPIGIWNVSSVTTFRSMFHFAAVFNQPIGNWNTSSATDMSTMFAFAGNFNQAIGTWNTQNVTTMQGMFYNATNFNQAIGTWNTQNVTNMGWMFYSAASFNQPIGTWNTQNVTNMAGMFREATAFNQLIGSWNTQMVTIFSSMFYDAPSFNQPIDSWNTQNATHMDYMFHNAISFNQPVNGWNTQNVVNMRNMFEGAWSFNQPLGNWVTSGVIEMRIMFSNATAFNQTLANWQLNNNVILLLMLNNCGMDCTNYSATINGWAGNVNFPNNRSLGAQSMKYLLNAQNARNYLINTKGWTISGDSLDTGICCTPQQGVSEVTACGSYLFNGQVLSSGGIYYDTLVSQSGCDSMLTLVLTILQPSAHSFSDTACIQYVFNNQTLTAGGTYFDTLVNAAGCDSILTLNLTINTVDTSLSQTGALLSANATGATYQWLRCNPFQAITGETNQNFTASANGSYAVAVTMNGCTDTSSCYTLSGVGLTEPYSDASLSIYPNPVSGTLHIESQQAFRQAGIRLLSVNGELLLEYANVSGSNLAMDVSQLAAGLYFLEVLDERGKSIRKILKQ